MRAYVINLERSTDRLAFFTAQAAQTGLIFERMPAVDGSLLSAEELAAAVASDFDFRPINAAEIGLFMSHRKVWKKLVDSGDGYAAIFEDDVILSPDTTDALDAIESLQPTGDIIKLETTFRVVALAEEASRLSGKYSMHRLLSWHGGTAAYIVSATGAARLLELTDPLAGPVDQALFNPMSRVSSVLEIWQMHPAPCIQEHLLPGKRHGPVFTSTIAQPKSRRSLFRHGPLTDIRRAAKKLLEKRRRNRIGSTQGNILASVPFAEKPERHGP